MARSLSRTGRALLRVAAQAAVRKARRFMAGSVWRNGEFLDMAPPVEPCERSEALHFLVRENALAGAASVS